jgi:hypothetical protein
MPASQAASSVAAACASGMTSNRSPRPAPPKQSCVTSTSVSPRRRRASGSMRFAPSCRGMAAACFGRASVAAGWCVLSAIPQITNSLAVSNWAVPVDRHRVSAHGAVIGSTRLGSFFLHEGRERQIRGLVPSHDARVLEVRIYLPPAESPTRTLRSMVSIDPNGFTGKNPDCPRRSPDQRTSKAAAVPACHLSARGFRLLFLGAGSPNPYSGAGRFPGRDG